MLIDACGNEGGITTEVQLPLRKTRAEAGDAEDTGKTMDLRGASERVKTIWTRSEHLHAGHRQPSIRHINRPDTWMRLTQRLEQDKEKTRLAGGDPHTMALFTNLLTWQSHHL